MEEALTAYLLAAAGLTGLVANRIQWARRPQAAALPSVALHLIGSLPQYEFEGASGLVQSRVQIDCWAETFASAKAVSRQVDTALSGVAFTQGGVRFQGSFKDSERADFERDEGGTDLFRVSSDYILWHGET